MGVWPSHPPAQVPGSFFAGAKKGKTADMDAIRKKMQSLKSETDGLYDTIAGFEEATREAADNVMKTIKVVENTCLNNEVTIEELDKNLRATVKMASDNEQKLDELSRKLGV